MMNVDGWLGRWKQRCKPACEEDVAKVESGKGRRRMRPWLTRIRGEGRRADLDCDWLENR